MRLLLGVDIGGTFTDFVVYNQDEGRLMTRKILTTPKNPEEAVMEGLRELLSLADVDPRGINAVVHATTLATNAIVERRGARIGFITTKGFKDTVIIGSEHRYDMQDLLIDMPRPLVYRRDIREVSERIDAKGDVLEPLDKNEVLRSARQLREAGCEAIAVGFLHSYKNPAHEELAGTVIREDGFTYISVSHEIAPVIREFGRFSTTLANAYVQPLIDRYTRTLERDLKSLGVEAPFLIMLSEGGLTLPEDARAYPVRLIESGPAAGVMAAAQLATDLGIEQVLSFDMGGTTAKGSIIRDGKADIRFESEVARLERFKPGSGLPLVVPTVDLIEIGAGGGSIAWVDGVGRLRVGPGSAGSDPGPACYGRGGLEATVTDADLLLGFLDPHQFAGGRFELDVEASRRALDRLARKLGVTLKEVAWGINAAVDGQMASAFRIHAIERGVDIRGCPVVSFGGAGPVHAASVAELLGITDVIYPWQASVYSAVGLVRTPPSFTAVKTFQSDLDTLSIENLMRIFAELEAVCRKKVKRAGAGSRSITVRRSLDMRYKGQVREIEVDMTSGVLGKDALREIQDAFLRAYSVRFHQEIRDVPIEIVNCRVRVIADVPSSLWTDQMITNGSPLPRGMREVSFTLGESSPVPIYTWDELASGQTFAGPALVESPDTVAVIRPSWVVEVLEGKILRARRQGGGTK